LLENHHDFSQKFAQLEWKFRNKESCYNFSEKFWKIKSLNCNILPYQVWVAWDPVKFFKNTKYLLHFFVIQSQNFKFFQCLEFEVYLLVYLFITLKDVPGTSWDILWDVLWDVFVHTYVRVCPIIHDMNFLTSSPLYSFANLWLSSFVKLFLIKYGQNNPRYKKIFWIFITILQVPIQCFKKNYFRKCRWKLHIVYIFYIKITQYYKKFALQWF